LLFILLLMSDLIIADYRLASCRYILVISHYTLFIDLLHPII